MSKPIVPQSSQMRFLQESGPGRSRSGRLFERIGSVAAPAIGSENGERRTFYVETYGCEMNRYDSDFIASRFLDEGYVPAPDPESADVLLFNTCSVRQGAEDRQYAQRLEHYGRAHPDNWFNFYDFWSDSEP